MPSAHRFAELRVLQLHIELVVPSRRHSRIITVNLLGRTFISGGGRKPRTATRLRIVSRSLSAGREAALRYCLKLCGRPSRRLVRGLTSARLSCFLSRLTAQVSVCIRLTGGTWLVFQPPSSSSLPYCWLLLVWLRSLRSAPAAPASVANFFQEDICV
jgi:hypothetical protein